MKQPDASSSSIGREPLLDLSCHPGMRGGGGGGEEAGEREAMPSKVVSVQIVKV